jgi:thiol-disulfide isomerase/thioredoxin
MKPNLCTILYFLTSSILLAQFPEGTLSIEDPDFNKYFMNTAKIPIVKGKILNLSPEELRKINISYAIVTPLNEFHVNKVTNINSDGTFNLQLDYPFPYQQIWMSIGDTLYTCLYANSDLFIELDAAKVDRKKGIMFNGEGVKFLGNDGELTSFMNNHILFKRKEQLEIDKEIQTLMANRQLPMKEFIPKYDKLYSELQTIDNEFIKNNPSDYSWVIDNERMSHYYGELCVIHWGKTMSNELWEKVKNHKSYLTSNDGMQFYKYLYTYLSYYARVRQTNVIFSDTIFSINTLKTIKCLDSIFKPAKADLLKIKMSSRDPKEQKIISELVLTHMSTDWCQNIVKAEYQKTIDQLKAINSILNQSKPITSITSFGQPVTELSFGAKLFKVNNIKAPELLANLKSSFNGKALFIDFWATWCAPCLSEMPYSKRLHTDTKALPIEFVYLCTSNNSGEDKWKTKIAELEIPGTHIFVEETIETELMNLFSMNGFPSYAFINASGVFVPDAIVRPSITNKSKIKELLEKTEYAFSQGEKRLPNTPVGGVTSESKSTKLDPNSKNMVAKYPTSANMTSQMSFEGIGIQFNISSDTILVRSPMPGGPSEKAGLLSADKIIYINDTLVAGKGISYENVMKMLKGPRGTKVKIKVFRQGHKDLIPFEIIRDKISIN